MYDTVIVRYGEIFLKSEYVKKEFENRLIENIRLALKKKGVDGKIIRRRHRVYVDTGSAEEAADIISRVFGVVSVSPAKKTTSNLEDLGREGLIVAEKTIREGESFRVSAKRTGTHEYTSIDVEKAVAEKIIEKMKAKLDLTAPEKRVYVEVTEDEGYVFDRKIMGPGGLPYKTQGKVVALISTGIDSPVAAWMMMHRGCETVALHLGVEEEVEEVINQLEEYSVHRIKTYVVPHADVLEKAHEKAGKHTCIICKRAMMKLAGKVAEKEKAQGIVTGDSLGQVASQTLENLKVLSEAARPIYRPLIGMDKEEIIERARNIGTYELAKHDRCPYVPAKPATRSDLEEIKKLEEEIGVDEILEGIELRCQER